MLQIVRERSTNLDLNWKNERDMTARKPRIVIFAPERMSRAYQRLDAYPHFEVQVLAYNTQYIQGLGY